MATVPVYRTWVAGEVVTAAYFNANVRDAGNFWLSVPVFEGRQTVAQSLTSGAGTAILLDTEDVDNDNGHSTSSNTSRYNPQTPGRFQCSGGVGYSTNVTGGRFAAFGINGGFLNGGASTWAPATSGFIRIPAPTQTFTFNGTTDYVELFGLQSSGGALNTDVNTGILGGQSRMSVRWVGTT